MASDNTIEVLSDAIGTKLDFLQWSDPKPDVMIDHDITRKKCITG